ncbi:hypothetical protein MMC12_000895 [Toensbergia leucococca]|nr:hypothetical protein [Toensbergia leucococca]
MATWKVISQMTRTLIENCVVNFGGLGGYFTYGLEDVAQAVASPVMYDLRDVPLPIPVEQPDGIGVDLGNPIIADNGGINIPAYMIVTVSGISETVGKADIDPSVGGAILSRFVW